MRVMHSIRSSISRDLYLDDEATIYNASRHHHHQHHKYMVVCYLSIMTIEPHCLNSATGSRFAAAKDYNSSLSTCW